MFEQDTSLAANLRRIGTLVREWEGEPLDRAGAMRRVNAGGSQPPLLWCFNGLHELPRLAASLGPDQPVIGMRSLHNVVDPKLTNSHVAQELAVHYAETVLATLGTAPCLVGGNCQAASVAYRMARRLHMAGTTILRFVTLDAELRLPCPWPMRLLFGRESSYKPFPGLELDYDTPPFSNWDFAYGGAECIVLPSGHGKYFHVETVGNLAASITRPARAGARSDPRAATPVNWQMEPTAPDLIEVSAPAIDASGDWALLPFWQSASGQTFRSAEAVWVHPLGRGPEWRITLRRPPGPGPWTMWPVLCRRGQGPVGWPGAGHPSIIMA